LRPAWANSSQVPISKITRAKWAGGVAQAIKYLLCKHKTLNLNLSFAKKEKSFLSMLKGFGGEDIDNLPVS
jgi:hypothetical protein